MQDLHTLPYAQVPKATWHPVPQYAFVSPQYPCLEQHSPNADPAHAAPLGSLAWLHVPSVDTGGPLEEQVPKSVWQPVPQYAVACPQQPLAQEQLPNIDPAHVAPPGVLAELQVPSVDTGGPSPPAAQVPKSLWHPVPQCPLVSPQ
ncbi:hypothetical protein VE04_05124 [Pseudogymnoascus sp. 24MN13]|nr:hypothetical protein VE04_05124 [Pseudogymnoascus sp. 24MN13]